MQFDAKYQNEFTLVFPSLTENIKLARLAVAGFAGDAPFTVDEIEDVKTAVSEAVTNAIVHAYPDASGAITLCARLDVRGLWVEIVDRGRGIPDVDWALEATNTTSPEEHMGLGFAFIKSYMDQFDIVSTPGTGTKITMFKRFVAAHQPPQSH